ncbi:oligosaccharide flippase family protein [Thermomonas aquatica]|uniref:Polysaccharide biosynthesis protein n=1 Tax=Thermomonas aquatica TaxID=2202149 RepID=A0A5B7ZL17_9GAMM|nr:oligosaccharide flippase family protein [Thermomonas aquatica]QDA55860.1 polysaccharide biosynthesis protein [Thermomonas aquatica]
MHGGHGLGDAAHRARQRRLGGMLAYLQIALNIGIALAYTPFMVRTLGQADYGLFAIAGAMASYLVILDMGLADSVVRRLVGLHGKDDRQGERDFLGSMVSLYGVLGLMILGAAAIAIACVPMLFGGTMAPDALSTLQTMLVPLGISTAVVVAGNPLNATLVAHERFVFLRSLEMATVVLVTLGNVAALLLGGGVLSVVVVASSGAMLATLCKWLMVRGGLRLPLAARHVDRTQLTGMSSYAAPIFVSMLVEQIFWKLDNILIGARLGAAAVAVYAIGVMFNKYFMAFATAISRVMMPDLVRRIDAGSDTTELTGRLVEVSRWQAFVLMLVLSGLVLFGEHFIRTWMGPGYELSYWVLVCTLGPYAFELIGNVRNVVLQVKGLYWWRAGIFLAAALVNIPATLLAMRHWGIVGAAVCTGGGILAAYIGVAWVLSSKAGIPVFGYLRGVWKGIAPALLLSLPVGWVLHLGLPAQGWFALALKIAVYTLVYLGLMWAIALNGVERMQVRGVLAGGRRG